MVDGSCSGPGHVLPLSAAVPTALVTGSGPSLIVRRSVSAYMGLPVTRPPIWELWNGPYRPYLHKYDEGASIPFFSEDTSPRTHLRHISSETVFLRILAPGTSAM